MKVLQTLIFIFFPILIYLLIALGLSVDFKHLKKSKRKNKVLFGLVFLILSCIILPCLMVNRNIYLNIILGRISYKDLEVANYSIIINTLLAFLLGLFAKSKHQSISYKETAILMLLVIIGFIEVVDVFKYSYYQNNNLIISEVCRKEINEYLVNEQETKTEKSYITIYNPNKYDCYVENLYLSTDEDNLKEDIVPSVVVPKKGTYTIYYEYGDFDISKSKETTIFLSTDRSKSFIDYVVVPTLEDDYAYTLNTKDNTWKDKKLNTLKLEEKTVIQTPAFDHESGFYYNPFDLYIDVPAGTKVYYTLDSSDPDENSYLYDGSPIYVYDKSKEDNIYKSISNITATYLTKDPVTYEPVDKCFVLRAIAIDENNNKSEIVTKSYFINLDKYKNTNVISLVSDPENLFDDVKGIYVTGSEYDKWYSTLSDEEKGKIIYSGQLRERIDENGKNIYRQSTPAPNFWNRGIKSEREGSFELFKNGQTYLNQNVGYRIQGNSSRGSNNKRFSIYSRKEYSGSKYFEKELYEEVNTHSVVLREGFINSFSSYLCADRNVGTQNTVPIVLFLDGEYWYSSYMQDKYSETNLENKYNLSNDNVIIAKRGSQNTQQYDSSDKYNEVKKFYISNDLSIDENYEKLCSMIDVSSYIDFTCINVYLANMDYSEEKNILQFHTIVKENDNFGDGRWKWALYDMDLLTGDTRHRQDEDIKFDYELNAFPTKGAYVGVAINEQNLFKSLKVNKSFCKDFVNTYMDLINSNFLIENVSEKMKLFNEDLSWNHGFFLHRKDYATKHLEEEFNLKGTLEKVTLATNNDLAGEISLNTLKPNLKSKWSGEYYTDYPVELSVIENPGYEFNHWEVNGVYYSSDKDISVEVNKGGTNIYAIFN